MIKTKINIPDSFFEEEIRKDYLVTEKTKKVWAIEIDMLNELRRVCDKHHLTFYADSGTLLGAIREHGFIPWDDDIDVVMFRKDYDKLLKIASKEIKSPFFLQCTYSDKGYFRGHAQMRYDGTTAILKNESNNVDFHQGIFLDIFPLDYTENSEESRRKKCEHLKRYKQLFHCWGNNCIEDKTSNVIKMSAKILLKIVGKKRVYKHYEKKCRKVTGKSQTVDKVSYYWDYENYKNLNEDYFGTPSFVPFEFTEIPAPQEYDKILSRYYGENYMTPQKLKSGHQLMSGDMILEPERSYLEVLEEMEA